MAAADDMNRLRCATYNVLSPLNRDWDRRRPVIVGALRDVQADVLALQEVRIDTVHELIGNDYSVTPFTAISDDGVGAVLATRTPHRVLEEIDQRTPENGADLPWCATLIVELDTPAGRLVVAHHKPNWPFPLEAEREQQAFRAAAAIEHHAGDGPAVVLGDFDAAPDAGSVQFWRGRRSLNGVSVCYQDAWETVHGADPGLTFTNDNPLVRDGEVATAVSRRIDYIMVRSGRHGPLLTIRDCQLLLDQPVNGIWASDHFGLVADLTRPEHPPGTWARSTGQSGRR